MKNQSRLVRIAAGLAALFGALSLLPWNCQFAKYIYDVGDLPARCLDAVNGE